MHQPVGIRALAISFPKIVRTNDYYKDKYPDLVAQSEQKNLAKIFSNAASLTTKSEFDRGMQPYLKDPFRGTVKRRVLGPEESSLTLEYRAACDALESAKLSPNEVDLMLVTSVFPQELLPGNASFLARQLGLSGAAWNLESMCSSAVAAFQTACAMVRSGEYHNVLVVVSCTYTRFVDEKDSFSWFLGDGAGAFVVSLMEGNQGILGTKIVNTAETCGVFFCELGKNDQGKTKMLMRASKKASQMFRDTTTKLILSCCKGAIAAADVTLDQIDFFIFNTPMAWYAEVCARTLGIDPERTINLNSEYANIGPVLPLANLYHAAQSGKIRENDLVLVYSIGSSSNAGATVMRWGKVALGSAPAPEASPMKIAVGAC